MRKRICVLALFCLLLGLFAACSSPSEPAAFMRELSALENYSFTAVGEIIILDEDIDSIAPVWYVMEGTRSVETEQFFAHIHYTDALGRQLYDMSFLQSSGQTYVSVVPLFQYLMDMYYAPHTAASVEAEFDGNPYLISQDLDLSNLLTDLTALVNSFPANAVRDNLFSDQGTYTLRLTGDFLSDADFEAISRPFGLFGEIGNLTGTFGVVRIGARGPLDWAPREENTFELIFIHDTEADIFTTRLTFFIPDRLLLTVDVTYREISPAPIETPEHTVTMDEMFATLAEYRDVMDRILLIEESGLEIIFDLPELRMVNHPLATNLLEPFWMNIGGHAFQLSILANAANTATEDAVFSISSVMSLLYTTLDARSASQTLAPFVLLDLGVEDLDAENFRRTPMRVNAHDTAAIKALYFDDNLVGRTLHIYVLQILPDTDQALFLGVTVIMDNMTTRGREALDQLGFYIGVNFQMYLDLASQG